MTHVTSSRQLHAVFAPPYKKDSMFGHGIPLSSPRSCCPNPVPSHTPLAAPPAADVAPGAALDPVNYDGLAPLHLALEAQEEELVEMLLAAGANPNQPSKDVASPLHMVAPRGPLKLLQLLLDAKADPGAAGADGWTPLHLAARAGSSPKVAALLAAGAAPGAVNAQGSTPLHLVSMSACALAHG